MEPNTLRVVPEDIIATYQNGPALVAFHEKLSKMMDEGMTRYQIFKKLSPECTYDQVKGRHNAIQHGQLPVALQGVNYLKERQLLPLGINHAKFPAFSVLASILFWRGVRGGHGPETDTTTSSRLYLMDEDQLKIAQPILDALGCDYMSKSGKSRSNGTAGKVVNLDDRLGRLVSVFGYPAGSKSANDLVLPGYIEQAILHLEDEDLTDSLREKLSHTVHDFIGTMLYFRGRFNEGKNATRALNLYTHPGQDAAQEQTTLIADLMNQTHPGLLRRSTVFEHKVTGTYYGRLRLNASLEGRRAVIENYRGRIQEIVRTAGRHC